MAKKGIDVSYANGVIDWDRVKNSGIEFAILRSTFGSESPSQIDNTYFQNAQGCIRNGIPFGTYHFAYFTNEQKAVEEADFAIKKANEYKQYVKFIVLDIEEDSERYANNMGYYPNWTACCCAFLERVRESGYIPVLYSNYSWLRYRFDFDKVKDYTLWYAAPDASQPAYPCAIWQYSWKGKVDGIVGDVDMDYLYDDSLFVGATHTTGTSTNTETASNNTQLKHGRTDVAEVTEISSSANVDFSVKVTAANGVNIRAGASTTKKILGAVPYNTVVKVTKQTGGGGYVWGLITYNGILGWIALDYTQRVNANAAIKKGDKVRVKSGAVVYGTQTALSSFVYNTIYQVMEVSGDRVVIGINGMVTTAVDKKYLTKVS